MENALKVLVGQVKAQDWVGAFKQLGGMTLFGENVDYWMRRSFRCRPLLKMPQVLMTGATGN